MLNDIEIISCAPAVESSLPPILFIHGAFVGAWCWQDTYMPWFAEHGLAAYALSLRGHGNSGGRSHLDSFGIDHYLADLHNVVSWIVGTTGQLPILVGHSMGGFVLYKYLRRHQAAAAVFLCSVPPQGLLLAQWQMLMERPASAIDFGHFMHSGLVNPRTLQELLFYHPASPEILKKVIKNGQPESYRAIWDMTVSMWACFEFLKVPECPVFVVGAQKDAMVPVSQAISTANQFRVEAHIVPEMGHLVMDERHWQVIPEWLLESFSRCNLSVQKKRCA